MQNGVVKKCCNGGVKLRCGVDCYGAILNVLWYGSGYVLCSVQFSLSVKFAVSVLCSVHCNVSSLLFMGH